jgi:hypothetical protein
MDIMTARTILIRPGIHANDSLFHSEAVRFVKIKLWKWLGKLIEAEAWYQGHGILSYWPIYIS